MRQLLLCAALCCCALAVGCGEEQCKGDSCAAGDEGRGGTGGTDTGGGGTGGTTEPNTSWTGDRPAACTQPEMTAAFTLSPFTEGFGLGPQPLLEPGFSEQMTVYGYTDNMTAIQLVTADSHLKTIRWVGIIDGFDVDETVILEQTRDWTLLRKTDDSFVAGMHVHLGPVPGAELEPLPGGTTLQYAMQCNLQDSNGCVLDAVSLQLEGDGSTALDTGGRGPIGSWSVYNRTLMMSSGCGTGNSQPFASLIAVEGRP